MLVRVTAQKDKVYRPSGTLQAAAVGHGEFENAGVEGFHAGQVGDEHAEVTEGESGSLHEGSSMGQIAGAPA